MLTTATGQEREIIRIRPSRPLRQETNAPILFLDIDGVLLAGRHWRAGIVPNNTFIPRDTISLINGVCFKTGCRVVISSTWRRDDKCRRHLRRAGFHGKFHSDWRTQFCQDRSGSMVKLGEMRGSEIADWLSRHKEIGRYAIIDDDSDMRPEQRPFFVKTTFEIGITQSDAGRLVSLLTA